MEPPGAVLVPPGRGLDLAEVGAAGLLGAPLAAGPERLGVAAHEVGHHVARQVLGAEVDQGAGGAVRGGQEKAEHVGAGGEEVGPGKLVDAAVRPVLLLIGRSDNAILGGRRKALLPHLRQLNVVNALPLRAKPGQAWLIWPVFQLEVVERPAREGPELSELGFNLGADGGRKNPFQVAPQHAVVAVLVVEVCNFCTGGGHRYWRKKRSMRVRSFPPKAQCPFHRSTPV